VCRVPCAVCRVPGVVKSGSSYVRCLQEVTPFFVVGAWIDRLACRLSEHPVSVLPEVPSRPSLLLLRGTMSDQGSPESLRDTDHAASCPRFCVHDRETPTEPLRRVRTPLPAAFAGAPMSPGVPLQRTADRQRARLLVYVTPLQAQCFALAQADRKRDGERKHVGGRAARCPSHPSSRGRASARHFPRRCWPSCSVRAFLRCASCVAFATSLQHNSSRS
jgi:hypothetical protein